MTAVTKLKSILYPLPNALARNHRNGDLERVKGSVQEHYHRGWRSKENQAPDEYEADLADHVFKRLESDRRTIVPWLDSVKSFRGSKVLEIGCGTGSFSVAVGEQGARVTGIDIDGDALIVARERCEAYGVECAFELANIADYRFADDYDYVIFFASFEHMTISERLAALKSVWSQMKKGAYLCIVETPNRLWHTDLHTSWLPFFNWLPDELAFHYADKSVRLAGMFSELTDQSLLKFRRHGRGASFHEFHLALDDPQPNVVSCLWTTQRWQWIGRPRDWLFKAALRQVMPELHPAWFFPSLDLVIER